MVETTSATRLQATTLQLVGSLPGPESPLPAITSLHALPPVMVEGMDDDMAARVAHGRLGTPLPYARLSDYSRADDDVELPALVLDNGILTATVLPTLGGRVWSLYDRSRERELLFVNPRLRFANFGLTDGWFAGGIEWNVGSTGHWTLSSRSLHAARTETPTGAGLRLWEWERTRDLVIQIDLELDGDRLVAHTRVVNPDPEPKPLYYWTNIAVTETPRTRVLSEARTAWRTDYSGRLTRVQVPHPDSPDVDISYPSVADHARDYFFESDPPGRFVAAVEPDGRGFAQTGTDELRGRKLFLWGTGPGGDRWQEWLCGPGARYAEIQAGWCTTQMEHDVIDGHAQVSWTEVFEGVEVTPEAAAAPFPEAAAAVRDAVHAAAVPADVTERHARWLAEGADAAPAEILHVASGWGRAELDLRTAAGEQPPVPVTAIPFPDAALPDEAGDTIPGISDRWRARYDDARYDEDPWGRYARAVNAHVRGESVRAEQEYAAAVELAEARREQAPIGAVRGLALVAVERGDDDAAREAYARALAQRPADRLLLTEAVTHLLDIGDALAALALLDAAPADVADHGRSRLLRAHALLATGDRAGAAALLEDLEVPDLAEGGRELDALWALVHPGEPLPGRLDFRMQEV